MESETEIAQIGRDGVKDYDSSSRERWSQRLRKPKHREMESQTEIDGKRKDGVKD